MAPIRKISPDPVVEVARHRDDRNAKPEHQAAGGVGEERADHYTDPGQGEQGGRGAPTELECHGRSSFLLLTRLTVPNDCRFRATRDRSRSMFPNKFPNNETG